MELPKVKLSDKTVGMLARCYSEELSSLYATGKIAQRLFTIVMVQFQLAKLVSKPFNTYLVRGKAVQVNELAKWVISILMNQREQIQEKING